MPTAYAVASLGKPRSTANHRASVSAYLRSASVKSLPNKGISASGDDGTTLTPSRQLSR